MTALRSAETRLPGVRAANTGVSALIDSEGRVRAKTRIFERDLVVGNLELSAQRATTAGHYADFFAYACTAATVLCSSIAVHKGRKKTS